MSGRKFFDPRHQKRVELLQQLFARSFNALIVSTDKRLLNQNVDPLVLQILERAPEIDEQIKAVAPERAIADMNQVDLAVLRLICFEALEKDTPVKVLINEGIELAKEFGTEASPKFVNGVLGKILLPEQKVAHEQ